MNELTRFFIDEYFKKYKHIENIPEDDVVEKIIEMNIHRIITVKENDKYVGAALFLTLTDETYDRLEKLEICNEDVMTILMKEEGKNAHFIIVAGDGVRTLLKGLRKLEGYKTASWWDPEMRRLHKYKLGGKNA